MKGNYILDYSTLHNHCFGPLAMIFCRFGIPPKKGEPEVLAVRDLGKTGLRVAAVGCECLGGESLRLRFGTGLKSVRELTDPREREAGSPAPLAL